MPDLACCPACNGFVDDIERACPHCGATPAPRRGLMRYLALRVFGAAATVTLMACYGITSDYDCYACHERGKPPPIRYDTNHTIIIPKEHANLVMGHGRHERNNNCFNCHNEHNLEQFQTRDGREMKVAESTALCGSCDGPTYRDWEAGIHGRTSGHWARELGDYLRRDCVECHNPHAPKFPGRKPAPGPHPLHRVSAASLETKQEH